MTAGAAAAEIKLSGSAEMGFVGGDRYGVATDSARFHTDIGLNVDLTSETDSGLSFGAHFEFDDANTSDLTNGAWTGDNESVFISGAFGTLTMGEIDGAFDKVLSEVALAGGTIADDETSHIGYNGNSGFDGSHDNQIMRYDYAFGDVGLSVSYEQANQGQTTTADDNIGLGVSYKTAMGATAMTFGLGYQSGSTGSTATDTNGEVVGVSVKADFGNGLVAGLNYSDYDFDTLDISGAASTEIDYSHTGVGVAYTTGAWTVAANYGVYDLDAAASDRDGYGLLVNYDLGGGAVVQAGYGAGNFDAVGVNDPESYSLGVALSF